MRDLIRRLFSSRNGALSLADVDKLLEQLHPDAKIRDVYRTKVPFRGRSIEFRIDPDAATLSECLPIARMFLASLQLFDAKARSVASDTLLANYNKNWRFFSQLRDDGAYEDIEHPALTATQFQNTIQLDGISVIGTMLELCYSDKGLFAGHTIFVQAFDGLSFTDTSAELFG